MSLTPQEQNLLTWTAIYIFLVSFLLTVIFVWILTALGLMSLATGVVITAVSYVLFYSLSVVYRLKASKVNCNCENTSHQNGKHRRTEEAGNGK